MKQKVQIEINRRNYTTPDQKYVLRPKNAVFLGGASIKHELAKTVGALMLHRYGDIEFSDAVLRSISVLATFIEEAMIGFPKDPQPFITEAVPVTDKKRRVDLVRLSDLQHFEFETNKKIKKEGAFTFYI